MFINIDCKKADKLFIYTNNVLNCLNKNIDIVSQNFTFESIIEFNLLVSCYIY